MPETLHFETEILEIEKQLLQIEPERYGQTRNFKNGAVTRLSPYISRGVISTRQVYEHIVQSGVEWNRAEKLIQELCWRDYWQQIWIAKDDQIFEDYRNTQDQASNYQLPKAVVNAETGIDAVDLAIREFYDTGYMHNHMRMYVAAICTNIARSHWLEPAKWMYANLLDGDLASNHLSWQWVAGTFSNKKYYANQENINKYFESNQRNTFLDVSYDAFEDLSIPESLKETETLQIRTELPKTSLPDLNPDRKLLIYNYYNLDPYWHKDDDVQRILLLEPEHFNSFPVAQKCIDFTIELSRNIPGIQIYTGSFEDLSAIVPTGIIYFKEHPTSKHYQGNVEERDFISGLRGEYRSFFQFWKKVKKELLNEKGN